MHRDFKELFVCLNAERVRYLVVGGYAVSLHAEPRATKDLDIFVDPSPDNAAALFRALAAFGAPLEELTQESLVQPGSFFRMGVPPLMVDILPTISGVDFNDAWPRRVKVEIGQAPQVKAYFISAHDLFAAKVASGRPQDIADAEALRAAGKGEKDDL